jgi:hypothetical protein
MAVSVLLLLAGVVVLSAATRKPCLRVSSASWHVWKSGHMSKPEGQELCKLRIAAQAHALLPAAPESPAPAPTLFIPHREATPRVIPLIAQIRHLRAPPLPG